MPDRYSRAELDPTHPDPDYAGRVTDPGDVVAALRWLMPSSIPAVVLASLATLSVPALSDICRIEVTEDGQQSYVIQRPLSPMATAQPAMFAPAKHVVHSTPTGQLITSSAVRTPFRGITLHGEIGYQGVVTHLWNGGYAPGAMDAALAQVGVERAVALVHEHRLASQRRHHDAPRNTETDTAIATAETPNANTHVLPAYATWTR